MICKGTLGETTPARHRTIRWRKSHRAIFFLNDKVSSGSGVQTAPLSDTSGKEWRLVPKVNQVHPRSQLGREATYGFVHKCLSQSIHLLLVSLKIRWTNLLYVLNLSRATLLSEIVLN